MKTFGSKEVQAIARIDKMQVLHWVQTGAVVPFEDARGRGGRRRFSQQNLVEFVICRELNGFSIETRVMKAVLDYLRRYTSFWETTGRSEDHAASLLVISKVDFTPRIKGSAAGRGQKPVYQAMVTSGDKLNSVLASSTDTISHIVIHLGVLMGEVTDS